MTPYEIRNARQALGLTQAQLAALMGLGDKARVAEWERGARHPSPQSERLIRAYLDGYRPTDWPT